ncbi:MAG TPA: hypothetical protein VN419_04520 [Humidesulfovibrio sp.]|uniref:hypothetical protein n=1 Tax=Humidesulfovibrio sp. TaxID=2910988 RepID=UPI002CC35459|nr:hypothetical protein [Humidesulfovibrio sp.]HWR03266.1 hypothetical protein [Humidesulfovibrio sp.]
MLAEALLYARARLAGQQNPHGHLTELVSIWARHRRQRRAWAEHLTRARVLCLKAAEACGTRRTALVLGAGLLLDVPLEQLSALFQHVVLADLAFLPATTALASQLGNVELMVTDLSACLNSLPDAQALAARIPAPWPDLTLGLGELDFVYSANLLSQLPLYAASSLAKREARPDEADVEAYAASVVRAHLEALRGLSCPACLVTDTRERGYRSGRLEYEEDLLYGVDPDLPGETWPWLLAPRGELEPGLDVEHMVLGVPDVRIGARTGVSSPGGRHDR